MKPAQQSILGLNIGLLITLLIILTETYEITFVTDLLLGLVGVAQIVFGLYMLTVWWSGVTRRAISIHGTVYQRPSFT